MQFTARCTQQIAILTIVAASLTSKATEIVDPNETFEEKMLSVNTRNYSYNNISGTLSLNQRSINSKSGEIFKESGSLDIGYQLDFQIMDWPLAVGAGYNYLMSSSVNTHFGSGKRSGDEVNAGFFVWLPTGLSKIHFLEPFFEIRTVVRGTRSIKLNQGNAPTLEYTASGESFGIGCNILLNRDYAIPVLIQFFNRSYTPANGSKILLHDNTAHGSDLQKGMSGEAGGTALSVGFRFR